MKCPYVIKVCTKCKRILVANSMNFHKKKNGKYGLKSDCKKCKKEYSKQWRENNKEYNKQYYQNNREKINKLSRERYENDIDYKNKVKERSKKYQREHKEERSEYQKQYYQNNRERLKELSRNYKSEHPEKIKEEKRKYRLKYPEKIKEQKRKYRLEHPEKQLNSFHNRRLKEENQGNGITKEQWFEMMEFFEWKCAYSGIRFSSENKKRDRTIDHINPLNKGGEHEIWNCVPMYVNYNSSKQDKDMLNWYTQQEFYSEERLNKIYKWIEYAKNRWGNKVA